METLIIVTGFLFLGAIVFGAIAANTENLPSTVVKAKFRIVEHADGLFHVEYKHFWYWTKGEGYGSTYKTAEEALEGQKEFVKEAQDRIDKWTKKTIIPCTSEDVNAYKEVYEESNI